MNMSEATIKSDAFLATIEVLSIARESKRLAAQTAATVKMNYRIESCFQMVKKYSPKNWPFQMPVVLTHWGKSPVGCTV